MAGGDLSYECISRATIALLQTALNSIKIVDGTLTITHDGTNYIACYLRIQ